MMAIVPEEELGGVDVYLAAFRIRMSSSQAGHDKNQDIEVKNTTSFLVRIEFTFSLFRLLNMKLVT